MVSVVIPTRDRRRDLEATLEALETQKPPEGGFEVVVVDNGSTDGTPERAENLARGYRVPLRLLEEPRPGPAAARNRGIAEAAGSVILFLGDDTVPARRDLVVRHSALHDSRPEAGYGVLGGIRWDESRQVVTPFMRWLERSGKQFAYDRLPPGPVDPASYLYTSHLSLKRELLTAVGGFDARFPQAAVEDIEMGVRLAEAGLELDHHPELVVLHRHPIELAGSVARARDVGRAAALFSEIHPARVHPDLLPPRPVRSRFVEWAVPLMRPLAHRTVPAFLRERAWKGLHSAAYAAGYREGLRRA